MKTIVCMLHRWWLHLTSYNAIWVKDYQKNQKVWVRHYRESTILQLKVKIFQVVIHLVYFGYKLPKGKKHLELQIQLYQENIRCHPTSRKIICLQTNSMDQLLILSLITLTVDLICLIWNPIATCNKYCWMV